MSEKVRFPIRIGRGRCRVNIYDRTAALPYYRICYRLGAIRHQRTCNSVSEAISHAESLSEKLRSKDASVTRISGNELAQFQVAQELLSPFQCRVDVAANCYVRALKSLKNVPLETAVQFYLSHNKPQSNSHNITEIVNQFLSAKRQEGVSNAYLHDLRKRTRSLVEHLQINMSELKPELLADYFKHLNFKAVNHNNQLRVIRTFISFAKARGYLSEGIDYLRSVGRRKVRQSNYAIYLPSDYLTLLKAAPQEMLPPLVLLGLCGVRPNEMRRLTWADIRFETRTVVIDATQAKTASRRTIPLCESAITCLSQFKDAEGLIWKRKSDYWSKALNRLHRKVGVKQLPNGLRHSYISYRLTLTGNVNRTALEAGNSATMIHRHYHALVDDPKLAEEWFAVG